MRLIVEFTREGVTVEQLLAIYPQLTADQIRGALAYYAAHPARVDEDIATNAQAAQALAARQPR